MKIFSLLNLIVMTDTNKDFEAILNRLGIKDFNSGASTGTKWLEPTGDTNPSYTPIDGSKLAEVRNSTTDDYEKVVQKAHEAFKVWREKPAP